MSFTSGAEPITRADAKAGPPPAFPGARQGLELWGDAGFGGKAILVGRVKPWTIRASAKAHASEC